MLRARSVTPTGCGMSSEVLMISAEASSGLFALRLLEHWKKSGLDIKAYGVGTKAMEDFGFERMGSAEEMAVFGIAEAVESYSYLRKVFDLLVATAKERRPRFVMLMDYPEFNMMFAKKMYEIGIPVIYYISPQIWAWRQGRVHKIKKYCTKMFVLFPFEVDFYKKFNVPVDFVGHPMLDELKDEYFDPKHVQMQRRKRGIADEDVVIGLMPGSRRSEIKLHFQHQLKVAREIVRLRPQVKILVMVAPTIEREALQALMGDVDFPVMMIKEEPFEMILLTDYVLAASGTATLMVGFLEKPMVIMYRLKWITYMIALVVARNVTFFGIVNLIMGREIVPERVQHHANVKHLVELMLQYVDQPDRVQSVKKDLAELKNRLGQKGATRRLTEQLMGYFK